MKQTTRTNSFSFKYLFGTTLFFLLFACSTTEVEPIAESNQSGIPLVSESASFEVISVKDVVYAQGLSHESINSSNSAAVDLKLDIYSPDNTDRNRPLFMFIHGGAFEFGSKQQAAIVNIANFYASRGWVFISIDYRLLDQKGTIPQEWADFATTLPVSEEDKESFNAMYPAQRDAKAALRWIMANKDNLGVNTNYITIGGASAGANTAKTVAVSDPNDFTTEIDPVIDPTLSSTNLGQPYTIHTIIDFWGGLGVTDGFEAVYQRDLFDSNDPPLYKAHGTQDFTVPFSSALELQSIYEDIGVLMKLDTLQGVGHGDFNATLNGKRLEELAFDFIIEVQGIRVQ